ncbi:bifunctional DNA-formamidopyrimidine glycosylase/DNA-(apurinic or apyrimidinic site) lyase [Amnibacterium setariae]|uniref:Formamidopyrimidine-DNA glycosylase n=1 Tax=Amnibacterium setariae TaxID=2306585 RepID=A0A3A1TXU1_9MICO|nr:bifunctional DNA-formamidopyrimidine glycosylase/DNA-(apurinic or apyrimidinic site) lyase [Amnibacterium setariae]RIX28391.1 bifunctional DNA-formamidopyrimidine glycosylase/DNA-(apurinic or apyrimidinic site) lyase [Amnibacterium setariae]
MPELPEVEVVRAGLEPAVAGALVTGVEVVEPRSLRRHLGGVADFERRLVGRRLAGAVRRGKFLWLPVEPEGEEAPVAVLGHLGMSGQLLLRTPDAAADRQLRVRISLEHPEHGDLVVAFADQRIFGSLALDPLVPTADGAPGGLGSTEPLVPEHVAHIARDPLDPAFDDDRFVERLLARRTGLKRALLDQTLVSGIGNIYADEALWAARLHYEAPTASLKRPAVRRLLAEVRLVLERALADGGTSFDAQYVNVNGASGYFSQRLNAYGQQGRPCARCGRPIVREAFMNRSSHLCPSCQRRPRAARQPREGTSLAAK